MSPFFFKRMARSPAKHIGLLLVVLTLSGLICFLSLYREKQEKSMNEAIDSAEVICIVTNLQGTRSTGLRMGFGAAQAVTLGEYYRLPEFVKDIRMTKELTLDAPVIGGDISLLAVTSPKGLEKLDPALGGGVELFREDFYSSDEPLLIVSEQVYGRLAGETALTGVITDPFVNPDLFPDMPGIGRGEAGFTVAGFYYGVGNEVFMPFDAAMLIVDRISVSRSVDSISFLAKDNRRLDKLKEAASEVFAEVDPEGIRSARRFALTVHDEELRAAVAAFEQNVRRADWLIPAGLVLSLAAGFLVGFIITRSEKNTYALARSVGMTRRRLALSALAEQLILPLFACVITGAAFLSPLPALAVFALYALGCVFAVIKAVSVSPTRLLREQE